MSVAGVAAAALAGSALAGSAMASGLLTTLRASAVVACAGFLASILESALAASPFGTRLGHFGRNVFVSVASTALALSAWAGGWTQP
jgi:hypothetical protein